jgi:hypothetical protein
MILLGVIAILESAHIYLKAGYAFGFTPLSTPISVSHQTYAYDFFVLAKTGFIFCKIPKVFLRHWIKSSFVDLDGWKNGWFWFVWSGF